VSELGSQVPKKLKHDAIMEAILEVRFSTTTQPEFLIVRLAEYDPWKEYSQARLPAFGIPENIRQADLHFKFQPTFELVEPSKQRSVRIGPSVLSYHVRPPYIGWAEFKEELRKAIEKLFESAENLVVTRLGLRYVNALTPKLHGIRGLGDLDVAFEIAGSRFTSNLNVNFISSISTSAKTMVRIASPEFIATQLADDATVLADIDVFTNEGFEAATKDSVLEWLEGAHTTEKQEFFRLLKPETIAYLTEK
jgi:uncharacterized protein (TIGR04255 family)